MSLTVQSFKLQRLILTLMQDQQSKLARLSSKNCLVQTHQVAEISDQ